MKSLEQGVRSLKREDGRPEMYKEHSKWMKFNTSNLKHQAQ